MISPLRDRVTLLAPTRTPDEGGGYAITYAERATVAARRENLGGRTVNLADRKVPAMRRRFTFRHRDDLVFEMRLAHGGRTYRVTDIQEDEQNRFQIVTAEEVRP